MRRFETAEDDAGIDPPVQEHDIAPALPKDGRAAQRRSAVRDQWTRSWAEEQNDHMWSRKHHNDDVEQAMAAIARADFLPDEVRHLAEVDQALPIGFGQTNSQPRTVKAMLRLLEVQPGHSVLDVGAGSGWSTGLLGHLVGEQGRVTGVELVPELVLRAAESLRHYRMPWVEVHQAAKGHIGARERAPFHRILVSAEADELPDQLVDQLHPRGIMVIPVSGEMLRVQKQPDDVVITRHGPFTFVPLL